jgi:exodeoxyribonuclease VII large subunit
VIWKGTYGRLPIKPQEGLEVIATGRVTTFPGSSKYQIVIESLEPAGVGALMALLEERRRKLAAEGLFDAGRKRALPYLPEVIGVVTSPTGAVIRDILHRLEDRFPRTVLVWPVRVQGEGSAAEVAAAIRGFNAHRPRRRPAAAGRHHRRARRRLARGSLGLQRGSRGPRRGFESAIPLISAVGHETDTTLIDFAADRRAPTPTAAAEMAVPVRRPRSPRRQVLGRRLGDRHRPRHGGPAHGTACGDPARCPTPSVSSRRRASVSTRPAERLPNALAANAGAHRTRLVRAAGRLVPGTC